jgi:hypothetical protein
MTTLPRQRNLTEQAATTAIDTACRLLRLPSIRNEFAECRRTRERPHPRTDEKGQLLMR